MNKIFQIDLGCIDKIKIILHRIISVVYLDEFPTRNLSTLHPRWRVTTLISEREAGHECNRFGGIYSRPLMTVLFDPIVYQGGSRRVLSGVFLKLNRSRNNKLVFIAIYTINCLLLRSQYENSFITTIWEENLAILNGRNVFIVKFFSYKLKIMSHSGNMLIDVTIFFFKLTGRQWRPINDKKRRLSSSRWRRQRYWLRHTSIARSLHAR